MSGGGTDLGMVSQPYGLSTNQDIPRALLEQNLGDLDKCLRTHSFQKESSENLGAVSHLAWVGRPIIP